MRYSKVSEFPFTRFGETKTLKALLHYPDPLLTKTVFQVPLPQDEQLDFTAQKLYGRDQENQWWLLATKNVKKIVAYKCDFTNIGVLNVPDDSEYP